MVANGLTCSNDPNRNWLWEGVVPTIWRTLLLDWLKSRGVMCPEKSNSSKLFQSATSSD